MRKALFNFGDQFNFDRNVAVGHVVRPHHGADMLAAFVKHVRHQVGKAIHDVIQIAEATVHIDQRSGLNQ